MTHFVNGDTIVVNMNGHEKTIRFIGADTPETHKPNTPVAMLWSGSGHLHENKELVTGG